LTKLRIIAVGKDKDSWLTDGLSHYEKFLKRYVQLEWLHVAAEKSSSLSPGEIKKREATRIRKHLGRGLTIALADRGKQFNSPQLAKKIESWLGTCDGRISFLIGGAYGLEDTLLGEVDQVLSLSSLTFSHQVVRLLLLEQLFRAFSILKGTDYHK
jgi:23S rRNA (pseudouridine1915-N3)-methyltransferase